MALDFSELNGFAPEDDRVPFDPRLITGFTGARSEPRRSQRLYLRFGLRAMGCGAGHRKMQRNSRLG